MGGGVSVFNRHFAGNRNLFLLELKLHDKIPFTNLAISLFLVKTHLPKWKRDKTMNDKLIYNILMENKQNYPINRLQ